MSNVLFTRYESPVGALTLAGTGTHLKGLYFDSERHRNVVKPSWQEDASAFRDVMAQLDEYFAGKRTTFDVPLAAEGTPFQRRVWAALRTIPFGETVSYVEIARRIDAPTASRAVGAANGQNPISIIVPCHRVIGASGALTGFGGGIERKRFLLGFESGESKSVTKQRNQPTLPGIQDAL
jgi:methylated-DNA-[protein]-cysteine S-methyltransferase